MKTFLAGLFLLAASSLYCVAPATVTPSVAPSKFAGDAAITITWDMALAATTTAATSIGSIGKPDRSVQLVGTFNSSTVVIEGSNDGVNYVTLSDTSGGALSFTSAGLKQIEQITAFIRPRVSVGSTTSVKVIIVARGTL